MQTAFEALFMASGASTDAAMFTDHGDDVKTYFYYFSPAAVRIARSLVEQYGGVACLRPAKDRTSLLVGNADALDALLPT